MTNAFLSTMEWVWGTVIRGSDPVRQQEKQQHENEVSRPMCNGDGFSVAEAGWISPQVRQCEDANYCQSVLSSPAVRPPSPSLLSANTKFVSLPSNAAVKRALNDTWGLKDVVPPPSVFYPISSSYTPRLHDRNTIKDSVTSSADNHHGGRIKALRERWGDPHDIAQRFTEVFRSWGSESNDETVRFSSGSSSRMGGYGSGVSSYYSSPGTEPQLPVSEEDMRRRVMSAVFSQWELPPVFGRREQPGSHVDGEGDGPFMGRTLFAPVVATPSRDGTEDAAVDRSDSPITASIPQSVMGAISKPREQGAHRLALRILEVGALLKCRSRDSDPVNSLSTSSLSGEQLQHARGCEDRCGLALKLDQSLLFSVHTVADQHVRTVYEDLMGTVCGEVVEEEVTKYLQLMKGATLRALDHWMVNTILDDITDAKQEICPTLPMSLGIRSHIISGKAAVPTMLVADDEDELVYHVALRRGNGNVDQLQDVAVRFNNGLSLSYQQIATLNQGRWLNDQVINAYLSLICEEHNARMQCEEVVSLGTHFFAKVEQELKGWTHTAEMRLPPLHANSGVLRWLKRRRHVLYSGTTRIILVPVNLSQTHWALVVLNWELRTWFYYDSHIYGKEAMLRGDAVLQQLVHVFSEARRLLPPVATAPPSSSCAVGDDDAAASFHVKDCSRVVAEPLRCGERHLSYADGFSVAPQQNNSYDCGVFVSHVAWCMVHGVAPNFLQEDVTALRRIMVHELLCQQTLLRLPVAAFTVL